MITETLIPSAPKLGQGLWLNNQGVQQVLGENRGTGGIEVGLIIEVMLWMKAIQVREGQQPNTIPIGEILHPCNMKQMPIPVRAVG